MKILAFSKRNFKEIMGDPISVIFNVFFPVALLLIFQLITLSIGDGAKSVPQFKIENLAPNMAMFGFSFLTLFLALLVSKDRTTAFLIRLKVSPLKPYEYVLGYTLPMIPIAFFQITLLYAISFLFGLKLSLGLLITYLTLLPIMIFFIFCGLLFGCLLSFKSVGGVSSVLINVCAIFGGIFMPLDSMTGAFTVIAYALPFANTSKTCKAVMTSELSNFTIPLLIVLGYTLLIFALSLFAFKKVIKKD